MFTHGNNLQNRKMKEKTITAYAIDYSTGQKGGQEKKNAPHVIVNERSACDNLKPCDKTFSTTPRTLSEQQQHPAGNQPRRCNRPQARAITLPASPCP